MKGRDARIENDSVTIRLAVHHSLAWLVVANAVGVLLATLLLFPGLNRDLGQWTYGRWVPVHLNLQLYGWCSLPSVTWLLKVYGADRAPASGWSRSVLWGWSAALAIGSISWLEGGSSGKLFLDWQGYPRVLFPLATLALWSLLVWSLRCEGQRGTIGSKGSRLAKAIGLGLLFFVPFVVYWSASLDVYPVVNPETGGPTGTSLLESSLGIVLILLLLPLGFGQPRQARQSFVALGWAWWVLNIGLSLAFGRGNRSHHEAGQIAAVASLLPWVILVPLYYGAFPWPARTLRWRRACLAWWGGLVLSACVAFLPGVLDRAKFTDVLVAHSHLAMAGFISSLNVWVLATLLEDSDVFDTPWAFALWQGGTLGYIAVMLVAGWCEGLHPDFTIVPGPFREALYALRLLCGGLMLIASAHWLFRAARHREPTRELGRSGWEIRPAPGPAAIEELIA